MAYVTAEARPGAEVMGYPTRVFWEKRLQEIEGSRVKGGVAGAVCEVCSR